MRAAVIGLRHLLIMEKRAPAENVGREILTDEEADQIRLLVREQGEAEAARDLRVNRQTLARGAAQLPLNLSTAEIIRYRLSIRAASVARETHGVVSTSRGKGHSQGTA